MTHTKDFCEKNESNLPMGGGGVEMENFNLF
jgi:hypothetical protein